MKKLVSLLNLFGVDPPKTARSIRGLRPYLRNRRELRHQAAAFGREFPFGKAYPCLADRYEESGVAAGDYFHQDLYVAQLVFKNNPRRHVDVGSRVDGFVAHVAAFRAIEVFDIRELHTNAANISFRQRDLMQERPDLDGCTDSLSCLHTLEHFGLGRYGDPVDYQGYRKGWENLWRMLEPGGRLYFSTPIGPQRIEFDAHRVFTVPFLMDMIRPGYHVESFAYVNDKGELMRDANPRGADAGTSFGCRYGCGIFELIKLAVPAPNHSVAASRDGGGAVTVTPAYRSAPQRTTAP
jgi:SAM-dependent methyltransferase